MMMFSFGKPSKKKFAQLLCDAISAVNRDASFQYDAVSFCLVSDGVGDEEDSQTVNLANLYAEHCALPKDQREQNLRRIASIFSGTPPVIDEDFETARPHLRPKIWNRSTFEFMELKRRIEGGKDVDLPLYPVGSHLYSTLVYDTENAMRSISKSELQSWGVTYFEAMEIACENLDAATEAYAKIGDHFYSSATGDSYDSSRVMLLDRVREFDVSGDLIAVVPQRDAFHMASSDDESALQILFDITEKTIGEEPRPLCPLPMRLRDGEWVDWAPPRNHVLRPCYDRLEMQFLGGLYNEQKELLEKCFFSETPKDAPFVASFSAITKDDEWPKSYCVWADGVDSLLPRTQMLMLGAGGGIAAAGEWEHVASVVGDLMVADESYYPTRFRVREFPSHEMLSEIGVLEM